MNDRGSSFWNNGSVPLIEPALFSSVISVASDIALVVDQDGHVLSVITNEQSAFDNLAHWEGRNIEDVLAPDSKAKIGGILDAFRKGEPIQKSVELNHADEKIWEFPIRYSFHAFNGDKALLLLGRDLRPIAETQQQLIQAQMSLEQGYEARREFDARYRLLLRTVQDPIVFVSVADGRIKDLNEPAAAILGSTRDDLIGSGIAQEFRDRRREEFIESLINSAISESSNGFELHTRRTRTKVTILPAVFRAAGERVLICRLSTAESVEAKSDAVTLNMAGLFEKGSDGIVFTDVHGQIQNCNEAFLDIVDAAHQMDVKSRSLGDFLGRGQIDMSVLIENARRSGQMRMYSTKVVNEYGAKTAVEMSVTYLNDQSDPELGFIIRDTSRIDAMRRQSGASSEDSTRNVMELVGSAPLKEIVADTTDVVEKMCIETAVNLTRNNRVAAAEMLGLSRQSLYVKLRKYGLLNKDADAN